MFQESLYEETREVLEKIGKFGDLKSFYLAGGTALALQLGHRKSIDLDLFSAKFPNIDVLKKSLSTLEIKVINENNNTLDLNIHGVKVSFLEYNYPIINSFVLWEEVSLASIMDIACMKLTAISSRGSKKDFVDLYYILSSGITLEEIIDSFKKKYIGIEYVDKHIIKSLTYFEDANLDPDVEYLGKGIDWEDIKKYFSKTIVRY